MPKRSKKRRHSFTNTLIALLVIALIACLAYYWYNYIYLPQEINRKNESFSGLYKKASTDAPSATPEATEVVMVDTPSAETETPPADARSAEPETTPVVTASTEPPVTTARTADTVLANTPTAASTPAAGGTPAPTDAPEVTNLPTEEPTAKGTAAAETAPPSPAPESVEDVKLGTAGPDTVVYSSELPPEPNEAFDELLKLNGETVGFLRIGDMLELPVAQRLNDNEYYLSHSFDGENSKAGSLFLDGSNRIYPRDQILYVYGHNMKNGTMFGILQDFAFKSVLSSCPIIGFDTLYEEAEYVPFACFNLTADQSSRKYFEIRRFAMTEKETGDFIEYLKSISILSIPVDVRPNDEMLMLVTCSYDTGDSRFVLALRKLREGESKNTLSVIVNQAAEKNR